MAADLAYLTTGDTSSDGPSLPENLPDALTLDEISALRATARLVLRHHTEQAAYSLVKELGSYLQQAGKELHEAAEALKFAGKMQPALRAHKASQQALGQAKGLVE